MNFHKVVIFGVLFVSSFAGAAEPYRLMPVENDEFRDYTFLELQHLVGTDAAILSEFKCDGRKEFSLFTTPSLENSNADSLRVNESGKTYFYRDGTLFRLDGKKVSFSSFRKKLLTTLQKIESLPSGKSLLDRLERSRFPVSIEFGTNRFEPREEGGKANYGIYEAQAVCYFFTLRKPDNIIPFHQIGVGGVVHWNPDLAATTLEDDGVVRSFPPAVSLAHELYHAYDSIRGLLDIRFVDGATYETEPVLEYRAVYFENQTRQELGLRYRKYYGQDASGPGMLDAYGKPIGIPSPCWTKSGQ